MSTANISLAEIIRRKRDFVIEELNEADPEEFEFDQFDSLTYEEYKANHEGEIRAYTEMLGDVDVLSEEMFIKKYTELGDAYNEQVRTGVGLEGDNVIDFKSGVDLVELKKYELMGYCCGVEDVMFLFYPVNFLYEYD